MREKGQTEVTKTLETPVFSRGIEILTEKIKFYCSKILLHKQANHSFWDWNEEKTIFSNPEGVMMNYDTEIANRQKEILKATFKTVLPHNDKS